MAATEGATALFATLAVAVAATATVWLYGSGKWLLFTPQQKGARASIGTSLWRWAIRRWSSINPHEAAVGGAGCVGKGLRGLIGNTPLIRIESLSNVTGCEGMFHYTAKPGGRRLVSAETGLTEHNLLQRMVLIASQNKSVLSKILGKAEFLNPGGSVKDRVAVRIIEEALESGALRVGGLITEGSAGSTGISLAMVASAFGCRCLVVIPDDAAREKGQLLEALGATVERVRPVSITHKDHFVNVAKRRALEAKKFSNRTSRPISDLVEDRKAEIGGDSVRADRHQNGIKISEVQERKGLDKEANRIQKENYGFFADQFENLANFRAHYEGTGPEIWKQTGGTVDAFVAAAGTGGTVAGVSSFLKEHNSNIKCYLIDPPGSGLFNRVTRGVMYTREEAEGKRLKNPFDTITEGIGINRLTGNFKLAQLDGAFRGTDREAVEMSRFLLRNDGLFIGSSSAMNCVGAVRVARLLGPGHTIVTILCDSGARHLSKFQNPDYLAAHGLTPSASRLEFIND